MPVCDPGSDRFLFAACSGPENERCEKDQSVRKTQHIITKTEQWDVRSTRLDMVPNAPSAWRESEFQSWLEQKLASERAALLGRLKERVSQHIVEHHKAMYNEVDAALQAGSEERPAAGGVGALGGRAGDAEIGTVSAPEACSPGAVGDGFAVKEVFGCGPDDNPEELVRTPSETTTSRSNKHNLKKSKSQVSGTSALQQGKPRTSTKEKYKSKSLAGLARTVHSSHDISHGHHPTACCSFAAKLVKSPWFEVLSSFLIILNMVIMCVEVQFAGCEVSEVLGHPDCPGGPERQWPNGSTAFTVISATFVGIFFLEFVVRALAMRLDALKSAWMWFDLLLVLLGILDVIERVASNLDLSLVNPSMMRTARVARMLRMMKMLKSREGFASLFLLMKSIQVSKQALIWSILLLFFTMTCVGMLMSQLIRGYLMDANVSVADRLEVYEYYGTYTRMLITMFELTMGNWAPPSRILMTKVSEYWGLFIVVYRCIFCFALVNVTSAVFITETNRVAAGDDEVMMMRKERTSRANTKKLKEVFEELDDSGDGEVSWEEFQQLVSDEVMRSYLATLDLEICDLEELFRLLDSGDGVVQCDEFVNGIQTLRGQARNIDLLTLLKLTRDVHAKVDVLKHQLLEHD